MEKTVKCAYVVFVRSVLFEFILQQNIQKLHHR